MRIIICCRSPSAGAQGIKWSVALLCLSPVFFCGVDVADETVPVGAAKVDITPQQLVLLAGYGHRTSEHEGVDTRIWARAMALGNEDPLVLVAVENCGVPAAVVEQVAKRLAENARISPDRLIVCSTHTHSAPTLVGYAPVVWRGRMTPGQNQRMHQYTEWLIERLVEVATKAQETRRPAELAWAQGTARFGGNRRVLQDGRWRGFGLQPDGPVDHSLPVLIARAPDGQTIAVWVSYACHCTTLGGQNRISGDWAGSASDQIERNHPGAVALTTIGCGADISPQP